MTARPIPAPPKNISKKSAEFRKTRPILSPAGPLCRGTHFFLPSVLLFDCSNPEGSMCTDSATTLPAPCPTARPGIRKIICQNVHIWGHFGTSTPFPSRQQLTGLPSTRTTAGLRPGRCDGVGRGHSPLQMDFLGDPVQFGGIGAGQDANRGFSVIENQA